MANFREKCFDWMRNNGMDLPKPREFNQSMGNGRGVADKLMDGWYTMAQLQQQCGLNIAQVASGISAIRNQLADTPCMALNTRGEGDQTEYHLS